jgi:hypothetical protein
MVSGEMREVFTLHRRFVLVADSFPHYNSRNAGIQRQPRVCQDTGVEGLKQFVDKLGKNPSKETIREPRQV